MQVESCGIPPFAKNAKDGAPLVLLQDEELMLLAKLLCCVNEGFDQGRVIEPSDSDGYL
jgi:hypothetical protein